jgi:hypothetical protein
MIAVVPVLDLYISRLDAGIYEVHIKGQPLDSMVLGSISEALVHFGGTIPPDFSQFVNVYYGGVSSGTLAVARLNTEAESIAAALVSVSAEVGYSMGVS